MKQNFWYIALGAAIGAGLGYICSTLIVDQNPEDKWIEDWEDGCEDAMETELGSGDQHVEIDRGRLKVTPANRTDYTQHFDATMKPSLEALAAKYNEGKVVEPVEDEEVVDSDLVEDEIPDVPEPEEEATILVVSQDDWLNLAGMSRTKLYFYEDDEVVTDERFVPIQYPARIIGDEFDCCFGENSEDEDVVYVLNKEKKAIYRVTAKHEAYADRLAPKRTRPAVKETNEDDESAE